MSRFTKPDFGNHGRPVNSVRSLQHWLNRQARQADIDEPNGRRKYHEARRSEAKAFLDRAAAGDSIEGFRIGAMREQFAKASAKLAALAQRVSA